MDLPLLAVTALGLAGVFLMLPRKKAILVRIGGLLGVLALGGFFLLLVRMVGEREAAAGSVGGGGPSVYFYVFSGVMIAGAIGVVCHPRPVVAALHFVLVTLAGAGLFVLLMAEFMAVVLVIVYAGAILVTYVFVIMLASQGGGKALAEYDEVASEPLAAVLVSFILLGTILQVMMPAPGGAAMSVARPAQENEMMVASLAGAATAPAATKAAGAATQPYVPGNIQLIGVSLYGDYAYSLELAGVLLTIALVGAVVIARKNTELETAGTGELPVE